jgi:hypothetical protein
MPPFYSARRQLWIWGGGMLGGLWLVIILVDINDEWFHRLIATMAMSAFGNEIKTSGQLNRVLKGRTSFLP